MKRAVVFRGGGSMGAHTAGQVAARFDQYGYDWDEFYGTSVGALVAVLASTGSADLLKKAFTTISDKDVWTKNPIKKNGKIKITNLLMKLVFSKDALGDSKQLRKTLEQFYTEDMFSASDKLIVACSSNYTNNLIAYGRNDVLPYKQFMDSVWASTSVPLLMNPVNLYGAMYQDGGLLMNAPIQRAINNGCDEVDVYMLGVKPKGEHTEIIDLVTNDKNWNGRNMIDYAGRSISMMQSHISDSNLSVATLEAKEKDVKIRIRYLDEPLTKNSIEVMQFNPKIMSKWFDMGYKKGLERGDSIKHVLKK